MKAMITDKQARLFARTILPDLYRLQERKENRDKPKGGIYHLSDENDRETLMRMLEIDIDMSQAS